MHTGAMQTANPLALSLIEDVTGYAAPHDVTDEGKVEALVTAMRQHGWQGAPIVVLPDYARALTGAHRLPAAEQAGIIVPGVDAEALFAECGIDLWERAEETDADLDDVLIAVIAELPAEVRNTYGLDLH